MNHRYCRQTAFAPLGNEGQRRLQQGRVLIVGCGALGGAVADPLVRAGVGVDGGRVSLMDPDVVRLHNLHRQTLFTERDAERARYKVEAARDALLAIDRRARIDVSTGRFNETDAEMLREFDLLVDATDNFSSRFVLNRASVAFGKPLITAGVLGASGQILTVLPGETACLQCVLDPNQADPDDSEMERFGILPPLPTFFAAMQATEAIKILSGNRVAVNRTLVAVDLWNNRFSSVNVARNPRCPVCGECRTTAGMEAPKPHTGPE